MANTKYIENKMKEYEEANLKQRHHLACDINNDFNGRKKNKKW